jgi:hypothetical protein
MIFETLLGNCVSSALMLAADVIKSPFAAVTKMSSLSSHLTTRSTHLVSCLLGPKTLLVSVLA